MRTAALVVAAGWLALGCGNSIAERGSGGDGATGSGTASTGAGGAAGGDSGAGGSGATTGTGGCESFAPCCDSSGNEVSPICTGGMPECPPGSAFPPDGICSPTTGSCTPEAPCAADEWCDYGDNLCGAGQPGTCVKRPANCDYSYAPVCTCDGSVASNECAAQLGGTDVRGTGGCEPPENMYACGQIFCLVGQQYCQRATSDVGGWPDGYTCFPLPASCLPATSCGCLANQPCGTLCDADAMGNLTLTCPGG